MSLKVSFDWVDVEPQAVTSNVSLVTSTATLWSTINNYFSTVLLPLLQRSPTKNATDL